MNRFLSALLGLGAILNGVWMIASPGTWYVSIPGVIDTGPFNPHFVRDIGCAFGVSGIGFVWLAVGSRKNAWPAASVGAFFLTLHALVHAWDLLAGREHPGRATDDLPSIFLPAILAWLLVRLTGQPQTPIEARAEARRRSRSRGLFARVVARKLASFERDFDYDTSYLLDVASTSATAFMRFLLFTVFADQRADAPTDAWFTTKLVAAMREDCGPCTQLVVRMAERGEPPVSAATLRGVLQHEEKAMSPDALLAYRFANAVLDRDLARADELRTEIVSRWGERALVTLSFAVASARVYPTMKYALGYGRACQHVTVASTLVDIPERPRHLSKLTPAA